MPNKTINDVPVDDFLYNSVTVSPETIQEDLARCSADLAYWNAQYAKAYRMASLAKIEMERVHALTSIRIREAANSVGKKITEEGLKAAVEVDQAYQDARVNYAEADAEKVKLYGIVDAVRAKKDMAQSLGSFLREEMKGNPMVRV